VVLKAGDADTDMYIRRWTELMRLWYIKSRPFGVVLGLVVVRYSDGAPKVPELQVRKASSAWSCTSTSSRAISWLTECI
jgi:hypothetical protein